MRVRFSFTVLVCVVTFGLLASCGAQEQSGRVPDDLLLTYEWREGSLPPPYHYSYSIRLQGDGSGEITMTPDYPGEGVPVWTERFNVEQGELDRMWALMLERGLFNEDWQALDNPPVGGSSANLTVVAEGRIVEIPAFLSPAQAGRAEAIYGALRAVTPEALFTELEARRAAYVAEQGG